MKALFMLCLLVASAAGAADVVKTCDVGSEQRQRVNVVREAKIASTYVYSLEQNSKLTPFFGTPDASRGDAVLLQCVGRHRRALIVSGEFTANAVQGFVLVNLGHAGGLERLDFAEKNRPGWLYLGTHEVLVVIATSGLGESNAKYVIYRYMAGQSMSDSMTTADQLPPSSGFDVIKLIASGG